MISCSEATALSEVLFYALFMNVCNIEDVDNKTRYILRTLTAKQGIY